MLKSVNGSHGMWPQLSPDSCTADQSANPITSRTVEISDCKLACTD